MKDDIRVTRSGRMEHLDAATARVVSLSSRERGVGIPSLLAIPPAHHTMAHLDTREGHEADLSASLPDATAEQLRVAAMHAMGQALRIVRAELITRGLPIPLPRCR